MDVSNLVRDKSIIAETLQVMDDGSVIAKQACRIHIPSRFLDRDLANIGDRVSTLAVYALLTEDGRYSVSIAPCRIYLLPNSIREIKIDGEGYFEFQFDKGDTVIETTDVVKESIITYFMYLEFDAKGKMPWYLDEDLAPRLFDHAKHFTDGWVGENPQVYHVVHAVRFRSSENLRVPWRQTIRTMEDMKKNRPTIVPLSAINITSTGTIPRLLGSYINETTVSALIDPADRVEKVEVAMRR